ncbi:Steroid C26-monooxygenase [Mycobacterium attenuatum]|uniref:Steroid C26-monooxygenase n=1 Tax=Mycobacterium attenuatum TaxID=2341086 RepID=A0A498PSF2_9MYCO|nr:Steroid C26-monooxygenase [Mycobacterium attenuatum]
MQWIRFVSAGIDFVADLGAIMPMRTIGYMLGIPEEAQQLIRDRNDRNLALGPRPQGVSPTIFGNSMAVFAEYIEWRATHPFDDLMTDLLNAQVDEPDGSRRRLQRNEVLAYTAMLAGAGNETTARLIGFMGQLLGERPDQRRELFCDPSLIAAAVEETLRHEATSPVQTRYVARDVKLYGHTVTEGSSMLLLNESANPDETRFTEPDRYDIHRKAGHLSFGQGLHFCLGSALARVAFEEVLKRWTDWEVDYASSRRARTSSARGWAAAGQGRLGPGPVSGLCGSAVPGRVRIAVDAIGDVAVRNDPVAERVVGIDPHRTFRQLRSFAGFEGEGVGEDGRLIARQPEQQPALTDTDKSNGRWCFGRVRHGLRARVDQVAQVLGAEDVVRGIVGLGWRGDQQPRAENTKSDCACGEFPEHVHHLDGYVRPSGNHSGRRCVAECFRFLSWCASLLLRPSVIPAGRRSNCESFAVRRPDRRARPAAGDR